MLDMAKKKSTPKKSPAKQPGEKKGKRYPSRDRVRYVGLPLSLHDWLTEYANGHSTEFDKKRVTWAVRGPSPTSRSWSKKEKTLTTPDALPTLAPPEQRRRLRAGRSHPLSLYIPPPACTLPPPRW